MRPRRSRLLAAAGLALGAALVLPLVLPGSPLGAAALPTRPGLAGVLAEAPPGVPEPVPSVDLAPQAVSAVLMDATSGQVLWAKNPNARRPIASVTKLMTMAIVLDAISSRRIKWNDLVSATEQAVQTPGAQIWLELGETMSVRDLFYAVAVQSANDASVALAEYVGGTTERFVAMMNEKAAALGMRDTHYTDPDGLDANGYSSAYDVALLSRYLVASHPEVLKYTSTWEYRLRGNKLWMVNRNKLLTQLPGVDGLKTGFTTPAGYCLAATAKRGNTRLIAVVLGDPTGPIRFDETTALLQWGFSHYVTVPVVPTDKPVAVLPVDGGVRAAVPVTAAEAFGVTVPRGQERSVTSQVVLPTVLQAPAAAGQTVGHAVARVDGREVAKVALVTAASAPRIGPVWLWMRLWTGMWPWLHAPWAA